MGSFIHNALKDLKDQGRDFSSLTFILPNKRAGVVLKNQLSKLHNYTFFSPIILSIEEFVEELSNLKAKPNIELLFLFYEVYLQHTQKKEQEPFDSFSKWAQVILQDFNEIDRYLIDSKNVFDYLN